VGPRAAGPITFGSFAPAAAINEATVALWSRVLSENPGSRLILKNTALGSPATRDYYRSQFEKHSIAADRVEMRGHTPLREHLAAYAGVDIALDPFPGSAVATACDALWMGVPVITLSDRTHASRRGASVLAAAGLGDLVAASQDDYIAKAGSLAGDPKRLADLRSNLRERVRSSALCDGAGFTRRLEEAYRGAWRAWCAKQA
jgi:protein O-GlcNAc transferase